MGEHGAGNRETSYSTASRPPPAPGRMSPVAEIGNKNMGKSSTENSGFGEARSKNYVTSFPTASWDDTSAMSAGARICVVSWTENSAKSSLIGQQALKRKESSQDFWPVLVATQRTCQTKTLV